MLGPGEPALWRKLWNGAVMTALPMRVVSDSPGRTVLYLAPDTAFRGVRTPAGTKVRDLASWVSKDLVWAGGSLIRLAEPGVWHCVDVEFDATGAFIGWYVNLQQPFRRAGSRFDTVDLVLDLVVAPDHSWRLKDEDDFQRAVADGHLTAEVANRVRAEAERMIAVLVAARSVNPTGSGGGRPRTGRYRRSQGTGLADASRGRDRTRKADLSVATEMPAWHEIGMLIARELDDPVHDARPLTPPRTSRMTWAAARSERARSW